MIDAILERRNLSVKSGVSIKTIVSAVVIALAVLLPQLVHLALGVPGGVQWLPMYLPVLIGGCVLGWKWGLAVGVLSPFISFVVTSLIGNPMPALQRLPFMVAELAVFAFVTGLFSKSIANKPWLSFVAVICAQIAGRLSFLGLVALFQSVSPLKVPMILGQIQAGLKGILVQAIIVPVIVMLLTLLIKKDKKDE